MLLGAGIWLWRVSWLIALLPLILACLALRWKSTTFESACRYGLTRTGAALAHGAGVIGFFVLILLGFLKWMDGPHGKTAPAELMVLGVAVCAILLAAQVGQAVAVVVAGTLARRAPFEAAPYKAAAIGFGLVMVANLVPYVGRAATLVLSALGLGSLLLHARFGRWASAAALALLLAVPAAAAPQASFYELREPIIAKELKRIHKKNKKLASRVEAVSERFLGTPYVLGPLGEGPTGEYDRDPLYDFKKADCTTLVEQVMAMSLEPDLDKALQTLQKIRYKDGIITYETRNHFTEGDWVPQNVRAGFLADITELVAGEKTKTATKKISKRAWYVSKSTADIQGFGSAEAEKERRAGHLRELADRFQDQYAALPYLPIDALPQFQGRIPSGTIGNLLRADQPDKPTMISHQVLFIRKGTDLYVRHAAYGKQTEDVPVLEYFYRYFNSKWPLLGVNLNELRAPK
jgi:hypothetical protein